MIAMEFRSIRTVVFVACLCPTIAGCRVEMEGTGPGRRHQELSLSANDEVEIGRQAFREVLNGVRVARSGAAVDRVARVTQRIAKAVEIEPLQREINLRIADYRFEWEHAIILDDRINAFCLPGGKIVVFSGLMQFVRNDDELATIIAHEVAHAVAHHTSERLAHMQTSENPLLKLAFNREQELEADHIGLFLMTFAGYDPDRAIELWSRMSNRHAGGFQIPEILSDHPHDERRTAKISHWVNSVKAGKAAYDAGRIAP